MSAPPFPYPPAELANYVGRLTTDRPELEYEQIGTAARQFVLGMLPREFSLEGSQVLDFGCGAGRVIRHFDQDAADAEIWGCDIDASSIAWAKEHLSPPFQFALSGELPPLPFPDAKFDLIYAISVYTHLTDSWSEWILEMHRLLRPGGFLVFSFLGRGMSMDIARVPWDEEKIGMIPVKIATPWTEGGPCVLHSPWWLRAHLGRAFEVIELVPDGTALTRFVADGASGEDGSLRDLDNPPGDGGHGMIVLRKDGRPAPTREQLEAPEVGDPREFAAMSFAVRHLAGEVTLWREQRDAEHARAQQLEEVGQPTREPQPAVRVERDLRPMVEALIARARTSIGRAVRAADRRG